MDDQPNADPAGFSGPVDPQGTPGGGSPPGDPLPALPAELAGDWPDAVRPQASQTADVRAARGKYATGGIVPYPVESVHGTCPGDFIVPKGQRFVEIPLTVTPIEIDVSKAKAGAKGLIETANKMGDAMRRVRDAILKQQANVEQIILGPSGIRIRIQCPMCGGRIQVEHPYTAIRNGPSHTMHGRRGRLVDIHVGGSCCGPIEAKVPVWVEDDWLPP